MELCNQISLVVLLALALYYSNVVPTNEQLFKNIFWALLAWVLYSYYIKKEMFTFEVSPWKKTCGQDRGNRCPGCCSPGFNGQPVGFEYSNDADRLGQCGSSPCCERTGPGLANNPNDYSSLGNIPVVEGFGGCGHERRKLATGYGAPVTPPGQPQGLLPKALGPNPIVEAYGGFGCGRNRRTLVTGYGASVDNPGQPQGLLQKALGSNPLIENYNICGGNNIVERFETDCGCG